ncbi:ABC transporter substrate-binding protein [Limoniibacter endophyticus]|uniref:ABC transporter substrate-binding protein n=1 Tax=Limoniibacter endophyticus TaxID=1565040 RepID=A0A8J3GI79_9HYPH|nr:ABC transporter substrate-binding protein [Limoniibacter endophyticus]GHC76548.1 ABC transporter substrate-binding protein [Limoniibacter endophyticus]
MTLRKFIGKAAIAAVLLATTSLSALAADIVIGRATEPSAIDPQFSRTGNNQMTADNMFETLLMTDANLQMHPNLATEWTNIDPLTWEITLRDDVTFHDGTPFTADDVVFSLDRTDKVPNSPAPFSDMVSSVANVEAIDDHKVRVKTKTPNPPLMEQIGRVFMVSKKAAENATLEDFNSGKAAIGTGPYQFISWKPAESLTLKAYSNYWGEKPDFENVEFRFIANNAARTAALLSGSVDLIDSVAPADVPRLEGQNNIKVYPIESGRLVYLALNMRNDTAPGVVDASGKAIEPNPFRDVKVRKAISAMIDRELLVDRILGGSGVPSAQIVPSVLGGYVPELTPKPADPAEAKRLLAEAGFPDGFGITLYSSNDRFPGDGEIAQAMGQLLARGGLKVNGVQTQPYNVYASAATKGEYGAFIFSLGSSTPNSEANLRSLLQTYNQEAGTGGFNRTRYSNPKFDEALQSAMEEFDHDARMNKLQEATRIAMDDQALVPLYFQKIYWASRDGLDFTPNLAERTLAQDVKKAK